MAECRRRVVITTALPKLTAVARALSSTGAFRPGTGSARRSYGSWSDVAGDLQQSSRRRLPPADLRGRRPVAAYRLPALDSRSSASSDIERRVVRRALADNCERWTSRR